MKCRVPLGMKKAPAVEARVECSGSIICYGMRIAAFPANEFQRVHREYLVYL